MYEIGQKVKAARIEKKLTLKELGDQVDLSAGYLSQFERGMRTVSVEALIKMAGFLDRDIQYFFENKHPSGKHILKTHEQAVLHADHEKIIRNLSADEGEKWMIPRILEIFPHQSGEQVILQKLTGEVFLYVLAGAPNIELDYQVYLLTPGDTAHFEAASLKGIRNDTAQTVKLLLVHQRESEAEAI
ncbi:helix-turn-helix domain-containing protein [Listeria costaricensis]|uniref:helix-turn-helix domain-containing protein n=1 Tax=Listeria costaricensis TaxID=2026604 RepID=UPI000C086C4D|nr:XRE family transcriptional regulator [Listeria costaricensis]